jgi:hypothetical protein
MGEKFFPCSLLLELFLFNAQCPTHSKEKISKFHPRRVLVAKKLGDATRSHQFTRLQTIPSIVTLFKTFSFLLGDGYPNIGKPPEASKHCQSTHAV